MPWARNACEFRSIPPALLIRLLSASLLTRAQLRQQHRHFGGGHRLNLPPVLVVEIADAQQTALAEKALRDAAFIGARLLLLDGRDVELLNRSRPPGSPRRKS